MAKSNQRRRFTIVELVVVLAILVTLVVIVVPVALDDSDDSTRVEDVSRVQSALRGYQASTGLFPTLGSDAGTGQAAIDPWLPGELPRATSQPPFAGVDFDAMAARLDGSGEVVFSPDSIPDPPRHAKEVANDGIRRWRIDTSGSVSVEMDGRSY